MLFILSILLAYTFGFKSASFDSLMNGAAQPQLVGLILLVTICSFIFSMIIGKALSNHDFDRDGLKQKLLLAAVFVLVVDTQFIH